ncbi:hypothetical protein D3C78_505670 [compost metagenome]
MITSFAVPVPLSTGRGSLVLPLLLTGPVISVTLSVTTGMPGVAGASVSITMVTGCDGALSLPAPSLLVTVNAMSYVPLTSGGTGDQLHLFSLLTMTTSGCLTPSM